MKTQYERHIKFSLTALYFGGFITWLIFSKIFPWGQTTADWTFGVPLLVFIGAGAIYIVVDMTN